MQTLTAKRRSKTENLATIRNNGMVPGVVYGVRVENTMISVPNTLFEKIFKEAGESSTITLEIPAKTEKGPIQKVDVLIHDIQRHPVKGFPVHIDFLAIDMNKPVEVAIPIEFTGIAGAEKGGLGVLVKVIHEVEVEALPKDLPHNITVDISSLVALGDQIHIKDLVLPKGVNMITDKDEVVALITAIKEEKEEAPVDLSAIEVEKKGKKEDESAGSEVEAK